MVGIATEIVVSGKGGGEYGERDRRRDGVRFRGGRAELVNMNHGDPTAGVASAAHPADRRRLPRLDPPTARAGERKPWEFAVLRTTESSSSRVPLGPEMKPARGNALSQTTRVGAALEVLSRRRCLHCCRGSEGVASKRCHPDTSRRNDGRRCTRCVGP